MFRGLSIRTRLLTPRPPPCRYSGTAPKRPSPYRLLSPISFLSSFAPLHVSGWRLVPLPSFTSIQNVGSDTGDLQDRRIVRVLGFDEYDDALKFICGLGDIIRAQDHHPSIALIPSMDYISTNETVPQGRYIVEISTHTHTPMPVQVGDKGQMRPGVTTKDIKLAEGIEGLYSGTKEGDRTEG